MSWWLRAPGSSSGVSGQQGAGSSPGYGNGRLMLHV